MARNLTSKFLMKTVKNSQLVNILTSLDVAGAYYDIYGQFKRLSTILANTQLEQLISSTTVYN